VPISETRSAIKSFRKRETRRGRQGLWDGIATFSTER
jgi:hypothetical protein